MSDQGNFFAGFDRRLVSRDARSRIASLCKRCGEVIEASVSEGLPEQESTHFDSHEQRERSSDTASGSLGKSNDAKSSSAH
jgi:transcription initiation factor TFIIIB Brf1 subunit/transcription initiation factor TFIIB